MIGKAIPTDPIEYNKAKEKIKETVKRWPSAYASGLVVQEYKRVMYEKNKQAYKPIVPKNSTLLNRWYKEKWVDLKTGKECGKVHTNNYYPTCRPSIRVTSKSPVLSSELSQQDKKAMINKKQKKKERTVHYTETRRLSKYSKEA